MRHNITKYLLTLVLALLTLPMQSQDFMNIFFKDGSFRKFYLKDVTEIAPSKIDLDGVVHNNYAFQYITTLHDKYVYNIEDVDSITFTKIDEVLAEKFFVSAMPQVFNVIESSESIKDVESNIDKIKEIEGIVDAWCDSHELHVSLAEGETFSFHFSHDVDMNEDLLEDYTNRVRSIGSRFASIAKMNGSPLKAVIANQRHYDMRMSTIIQSFTNALINNFKECGISVDYVKDPTVDFFYDNSDDPKNPHLYDYDLVLLITHGSYRPIDYYYKLGYFGLGWRERLDLKAHFIETSDVITTKKKLDTDSEWWADNYKKFKKWRDDSPYHDITDVDINYTFQDEMRDKEIEWVAHPTLTEYFFRDIAKGKFNNPNSFLFSSACQSLSGENNQPSYSFANIMFENRDLGVYAGYTDTNFFGPVIGPFLYSYLLGGYSMTHSIDNLYEWGKSESLGLIEADVDNFVKWFGNDNLEAFRNGTYKLSDAELKVFDKTGNIPSDFFLFPTTTVKVNNDIVNSEYKSNQTVTIEGFTTYMELSDIETGFEIGDNPDLGPSSGIHSSIKKEMVDNDLGKCHFQYSIPNLTPDQTYYYRAYTCDGLAYNYGETYEFKIDKQDEPDEPVDPDEPDEPVDPDEPDEPISDKELMLSEKVNGVDYKIYKKVIDETDYHENPDGWKCYKSELSLETTANGNTQTIVLDNKIYLDDSRGHHGGQFPCMLIDYKNDRLVIFCNSKDAEYQYSMEGYSYVSSLNNFNFSKEIVFTRANWGWYPFFVENSNGSPTLSHFSYAGYYAMESTRNNNGSWDTAKKSKIKPDEFAALSKQAGQVLVIGDNSGDDNPPSGDDTPTTSCPAKITNVELINAGYSRNEDYPNRLYFSASATLDDLTGVEEWGVYFDYSAIIELPFESVDREMSKTIAYTFKGDSRDDDDLKFDINSYVAEWTDAIGVYVKKRDANSGELTTIYGDKYQFKLRYDTPPSMVLSDPVVVGTEKKGEKYYTTITYKYDLKGAIWVDYVDSAVSGGNWSFDGFDETWYPEYDGPGESEWLSTYTDNTSDLSHTNWRRLHLRNYEVVNSNYVNLTGTNTITDAWVTDSPVYSRTRSGSGGEKGMIRNIIHANPAPAVRKIASYKRGTLGEVMK